MYVLHEIILLYILYQVNTAHYFFYLSTFIIVTNVVSANSEISAHPMYAYHVTNNQVNSLSISLRPG